MKRSIIFLLLFLLNVSLVAAATIHGTVYNLDLNPVTNVKVELMSPKQVFVATDGTYAFTVSPGTYTLTAKLIKNGTTESMAIEYITVAGEEDYVLDLILFPEVNDQTDLFDESDQIDIDAVKTDDEYTWLKIIIGVLVTAGLLWYFLHKKVPPPSEHHPKEDKQEHNAHVAQDDAQRVLDIIKAQGGRTTQKEIRKQTPLSEAKVSLIIAELEHKKLIEKIKQGRGNIIILKN